MLDVGCESGAQMFCWMSLVTLSGDPETRVSVCGIPAVSNWDPACHTSGEEPSQTSTCQPRLGLARVVVRNLYTIQDTARYIPRIRQLSLDLPHLACTDAMRKNHTNGGAIAALPVCSWGLKGISSASLTYTSIALTLRVCRGGGCRRTRDRARSPEIVIARDRHLAATDLVASHSRR